MRLLRGKTLLGAMALTLVVAAVSVPAIGQRGGGMATAPPAKRLFSHERHAMTVQVKCERCHAATEDGKWVNQGKKEHARCFSCHKFSSSCGTLAKKEGKVCVACHTTFKAACLPSGYEKPDAGNVEYTSTYSHRLHIRPKEKSGEQCEKCHGAFGASERNTASLDAGHALCAGCHARGVSPRIKESCDGCHVDVSQASPMVAQRDANPYSVKGAFDHQRHAGIDRVGTAGQDCLACHSNIQKAEADDVVPMPTMQGCQESCHNGDKAFNAVGTTCTRCHVKGGK